MLPHFGINIMILYYWLFRAEWQFQICNSKLTVRRNSRKIFTNRISLYILSKESSVGDPEWYTLTEHTSNTIPRVKSDDHGIVRTTHP